MVPAGLDSRNFYTEPPNPTTTKTRVFASGTLFQTQTFHVPIQPLHQDDNGSPIVVRANAITKSLNGTAWGILHLLSLFASDSNIIEAYLIAPLGGNDEGRSVIAQLERDGVRTKFCKVVEGAGVPGAWVIKPKTSAKSVILHNPLPDLSHEEFVTLLGPILIPENYSSLPYSPSSPYPSAPAPRNVAPFEWLHIEARPNTIQTSLSNLQGIDGLARERGWRGKVTFSLELFGPASSESDKRRNRVREALIPFVDVVFFDKIFASSLGYNSPRPFLLAMASLAPPHALLVVNWATSGQRLLQPVDAEEGGAALLSLPTKEYLQSSPFIPPPQNQEGLHVTPQDSGAYSGQRGESESVRTGSAFYADGHRDSFRSSIPSQPYMSHRFEGDLTNPTNDWDMYTVSHTPSASMSVSANASSSEHHEEDEESEEGGGLGVAFISAMVFSLTRRLMPGSATWSPVGPVVPPQVPGRQNRSASSLSTPTEEPTRWGLDECLRFATEFTGRRRFVATRRVRTRRQRQRQGHAPDQEDTLNREAVREMVEAGWL